MRVPTPNRETAVGAGGSVLLTAGYLSMGIVRSYSLPAEFVDWVGLVAVAVLVGGVVAVAANRLVPPERRTRRGHTRTALAMVLLPTILVVALLAVVFGLAAGLLDVLQGLLGSVGESAGPLVVLIAVVTATMLILGIFLVALLALGVLLGGVVLNSSAIAGYAVVTAVLERYGTTPEQPTGVDPPDDASDR